MLNDPTPLISAIKTHPAYQMAQPVFQYSKIVGQGELTIRLLQVLPSHDDGHLTCEIVHASIQTESTSCSYTALSYVWGNAMPQHLIRIRSQWSTGYMQVGPNLYSFLEEARRRADRSFFWIDAVCINQKDIPERNYQVSKMSAIYRIARQVVIWLNNSEVEALFETVKTEHANFMAETKPDRDISAVDEMKSMCESNAHLKDHLRALCAHEYWTRAWVLQEFMLARSTCFWCGNAWIGAEFFDILMEVSFEVGIQTSFEGTLEHFWHEYNDVNLYKSLSTYLRMEGVFCSDIRDRVYSVLSISIDGDKMPIDYAGTPYDIICNIYKTFDKPNRLAIDAMTSMNITSEQIHQQLRDHKRPPLNHITLRDEFMYICPMLPSLTTSDYALGWALKSQAERTGWLIAQPETIVNIRIFYHHLPAWIENRSHSFYKQDNDDRLFFVLDNLLGRFLIVRFESVDVNNRLQCDCIGWLDRDLSKEQSWESLRFEAIYDASAPTNEDQFLRVYLKLVEDPCGSSDCPRRAGPNQARSSVSSCTDHMTTIDADIEVAHWTFGRLLKTGITERIYYRRDD